MKKILLAACAFFLVQPAVAQECGSACFKGPMSFYLYENDPSPVAMTPAAGISSGAATSSGTVPGVSTGKSTPPATGTTSNTASQASSPGTASASGTVPGVSTGKSTPPAAGTSSNTDNQVSSSGTGTVSHAHDQGDMEAPVTPSPDTSVRHWSDAATWNGSFPKAGDNVVIPANTTVILDLDTPALSGLTIEGTLEFAEEDVSITADWITVTGTLAAGTEVRPYTHKAVITLTGDPAINATPMGTRGIMVHGGNLELHGVSPQSAWTKIDGHINAGASQFSVLDSLGWKTGDQIVMAPSDYYGIQSTEKFQIGTLNGKLVSVQTPVAKTRWGVLQYATSRGMSLYPDNSITPASSEGPTPLVLDERPEVGNISRNIIIQGIDDSLWQNSGFGAHVMIMSLNSRAHVEGVEIRRAGQAGLLGRYPFHWHRLSYDSAGNELGDAHGHYLRNSSIHNSQNRCITIHATNGVIVQNNVCYDIKGHGIFFEDAVERRNVVEGNLVLGVRNPVPERRLKKHESHSSGLWFTNPDNTVINNVFADAEGFGMWLAFPSAPVGASHKVAMTPNRLEFGNVDGNTIHSNGNRGVHFDDPEVPNAGHEDGTTQGSQYASTQDGQGYDNKGGLLRFTIKNWTLWKNLKGSIWDRVNSPDFEEIISADAPGKHFAGSSMAGVITRSLVVGTSLNNATPFSPASSTFGPPVAMATYHSAFDIRDNVIIEFPIADKKSSGAFATDDYYMRPVEKGQIRNTNNLLINSHPGYRSDPKVDEGILTHARGYDHFVFSGALWDPYGIWGKAGNWNVYNQPFFTHNASCKVILPVSQNATSCNGTYYGINNIILESTGDPWDDKMAIDVSRYDNEHPQTVVGKWTVQAPSDSTLLAHMRHFAAADDGVYFLDFPDSTPADASMQISNMFGASDHFILGINFSGSEPAQVYTSTKGWPHYQQIEHANAPDSSSKHTYNQVFVSNLQAFINDTTYEKESYWQDTANNIVWIKMATIDVKPDSALTDTGNYSDSLIYNHFHLRVW